ncbi:hypothetical protein EV360DRAFT_58507 [Lentinula raphanica]|nr:hypothetical protein EV360DRAFT_58507 [Lentinula raphanica]
MIQISRDTHDEDGVKFWTYALDAVKILGERGMSDEEDGEEDVIIDGVQTKQDVKLVTVLWFRHESFRDLFQLVDQTPKAEEKIFSQQGRHQVKRVRSDIVDNRKPPPGYPKQVFRPEYLQKLLPHEKEDLKFKKSDFVIHEFVA